MHTTPAIAIAVAGESCRTCTLAVARGNKVPMPVVGIRWKIRKIHTMVVMMLVTVPTQDPLVRLVPCGGFSLPRIGIVQILRIKDRIARKRVRIGGLPGIEDLIGTGHR